MIFHASVALTPAEEEHLANFKKYLEEKKLELPEGYDNESRLLLRFLEGAQYKYPDCFTHISDHH